MKHDQVGERRRAAKRAHVIRTAEWVLAQAYRASSLGEMKASQLRIRESIVREMRRRIG
jgi:hypothetical protein